MRGEGRGKRGPLSSYPEGKRSFQASQQEGMGGGEAWEQTRKGVSSVILTAKGANTANKKGSVPCKFKAVRGRVQGEGPPPGWEPKALKEEEALVRALRVVRGS